MCRRFFDNDGIRRLEKILERTFADLKIADDCEYAKASREFIAKMLLSSDPDELAADASQHLTINARKTGLFEIASSGGGVAEA